MKKSTKELIKLAIGAAGGKTMYDVALEVLSVTDKTAFTSLGAAALKMGFGFIGFGVAYKAVDTCDQLGRAVYDTVKEIAAGSTKNEEAGESETNDDSVTYTEVDDE